MAKLSVSEAAKRFHVSRPTLQKALKDGTISGERTSHNGVETWQIDVSELARLYKLRGGKPEAVFDRSDDGFTAKKPAVSKRLQADLEAKIEALRKELAEAEKAAAVAAARAEERQVQLEGMRRDLEASRQEKAALLAALPKPDATDQGQRKSFLRSFFRGRS